jgi:hypothetical protein
VYEAATVPKLTAVALVNPEPLIETSVPPPVPPELRLSPVTLGAVPVENVNWSEDETAEVPVGVVTVTSTVPAGSVGATAVIEVLETTVKLAGTLPNSTRLAPVKFVPVMVTLVPPAVLPLEVDRLVTVGAPAAVNVYRSDELRADAVPWALTEISTVPADAAGATATIVVPLKSRND